MSASGAARGPRPGRLIAVASGKGGVGKTWFAITLSHALARAGRRVLLIDGDFGLANIDVQLGLMPQSDLGAVLGGRLPLARAIAPFAPGGFDILPGVSGSGALASPCPNAFAALLQELRTAANTYDCLILDLPAGLDRATRRMAAIAELLLVIATEEPTSITDAYAVLKLHVAEAGGETGKAEPRIVVNQARSRAGALRAYGALARACTAFLGTAPPLAGIVRRDERVPDAIRRQLPLLTRHPASHAAEDVETVAAAVAASAQI